MCKSVFLMGAVFFVFLCVPHASFAALLYFDPQESEIYPGDTRTISLRLDTDEGECVNVVEGVISFSPGIQLADVSRGNSIFPLWLEDPTIDQEARTLSFAGGIPNGYCGRIDGDPQLTNKLFEMIFQAPSFSIGGTSAEGEIAFTESVQVYLNDGRGTRVTPKVNTATISINKKPTGGIVDEWNARVDSDTIPPQEFSISLDSNPSVFSGQYFISFNTTDKQSGIDHYEVIEESRGVQNFFGWGASDAPWIETRSPYKLKDQSLNSIIRVKAVDKAGNEYIATLEPEESDSRASSVSVQLLLIVVMMLIFGVFAWYGWKVYKRSRRSMKTKDETFQSEDSDSNETIQDNDEEI